METENYTNDTDSINPIRQIDFDVLGNAEIERISALKDGKGIEIVELYDNSEPKHGGLIDPRLGTTSNEIICATCGLNTTFCPGHPAHITLEEYVFHVGYLQTVTKILSCVCVNCSKLRLHKNENELKEIVKTKTPKERLSYVRNATKNISYCQKQNYGCGTPHPKIKPDVKKNTGGISIIAEYEETGEGEMTEAKQGFEKKKSREVFTAQHVYEILKNITDEDCIILGLDPTRTRPEYMIHKVLLVPPVPMRPSVRGDFGGGMVMADDLTVKLGEIIKSNLRIIKNKENQSENSTRYHHDYIHLLQYHVATYMENEALGMAKSDQKGRPIKSVASRLKGKPVRLVGPV